MAHQPTNSEDAANGNADAIKHVAYAEGYAEGKALARSFSDLYVVVSHSKYDSSYADETCYTSKEAADVACAESNRIQTEVSNKYSAGIEMFPHTVMKLDDYISMVKSDARYEGADAERSRDDY